MRMRCEIGFGERIGDSCRIRCAGEKVNYELVSSVQEIGGSGVLSGAETDERRRRKTDCCERGYSQASLLSAICVTKLSCY